MRIPTISRRCPASLLLLLSSLLGSALLLPGCLANGPSPAATQLPSPAAQATLINDLELLETTQGVRLSLHSDGPLPYQIFHLQEPPRLLLTFNNARLASTIQPKEVTLPGLTGIYPLNEGEQGSRLELALHSGVQYTLLERADGLDLNLLTPQEGSQARHGGQSSRQINQLRVSNSTSGTRIHLLGSGSLPEPESYRLHNPPRLVLDFAAVQGPAISQEQEVSSREVNHLQLLGEGNRTRLVIGLQQSDTSYHFENIDGLPIIRLSASPARPQAAAASPATLQAVSFTQNGATALVTLRSDNDTPSLESHREEKQLTLTLKKTRLAPQLIQPGSDGQRQDVQSFGGAVKTIDTFAQGRDTQVVIALHSAADRHEIVQQGRDILIQIKAASAESGLETPVYSGAKVTMDFKEINIHNALRLLADLNRLNLLISDAVKGTITMRLVEVPWDQALDLILESKGLGKVLQGNVLRVAPLAELQNLADARWQANESRQTMEPIVTEMIPISFAKAGEIRDLLLESDSKGGGATANKGGSTAANPRESSRNPRLLSINGSLAVDQRTNTLIVKDVAANQVRIRELVTKLDKPIPQVMIEARIVEIERNSTFGLGINWGINYKNSASSPLGISNSAANAYLVQQNAAAAASGRRALMTGSTTPAFNVGNQLPEGVSSNLGIHLGSLSPLLDLDIELGALETNGKAKTISSPRVLTANNKEASISQGIRQPYQTEALSGGVTYQYIDAALSLKVTPHVTANGFITLDVTAKNNSIHGSVTTGAPPALSTREVETQALVKDGQTIVLGGILQHNQSENQRGIPELKDIPGLGWLFKNRSTSNSQTELMVFITPRIVNPS
ncbi:MAG: type IV pilus secretin PilQ [Magnetococcales bacterium]|nr:type IV pilus secretin PilQ [Magnetococcales bacterium]